MTVKVFFGMSSDSYDDSEMINIQIGQRLRAALEGRMTIAKAAEIAGVTPKTLQRWLSGQTGVDIAATSRICQAAGASLVNVISGMFDESGDWETHYPPTRIGEKRIPMRDIAASAGNGKELLDMDPERTMTMPLDWLMSLGDPDCMDIIRVEGDSMEPDLRDGDLVMIDQSQREIRDGLFVVAVDDWLFVKRIRITGKSGLDLLSANPAYPPMSIDRGDDHTQLAVEVVGRVVWSARRM